MLMGYTRRGEKKTQGVLGQPAGGRRSLERQAAPGVSAMAMLVRRDSAVKLIDGLAGESPASAAYPVGTVVISGDGAGDQTVGSPEVRAEQRVVQEG